MTLFFPIQELSRASELGLIPYTAAAFIGLGALLSAFPLNLYFMNLPVAGDSIGFGVYFKGSGKQHLMGLLGGVIAGVGLVAFLVAASVPKPAAVSSPVFYALTHGAPLLSILFGMMFWKEFSEASGKTPLLLGSGALLFCAALGMIAYA